MIVESILNLIKGLILLIVNGVPQTSIAIPSDVFNGLSTITKGIGYVVPMPKILPIFAVHFALVGVRIALAIIDRIKSFIPTMGGT